MYRGAFFATVRCVGYRFDSGPTRGTIHILELGCDDFTNYREAPERSFRSPLE
jgi:hypothetical protein